MSAPEIGLKELRMLVEVERQMDSDEIPWVRVEGCSARSSMDPDVMTALGLTVGQTISWFLFGEILKINLARCEEKLAAQRSEALVSEVLGGDAT